VYSRFETLENYGKEDRKKLQNSKVAVIGLGATGSVIAENLARHGVDLRIVDRDYLEENDVYSSNIYMPEQCENALPKAEAAKQYLQQFTRVEAFVESLGPGNANILEDVDLIVDGTDNLQTRFLIDEYSQKNSVPWIYTAAIAEQGYSMFFNQKCFNCVFEKVSTGSIETCETAGVMREISSQAALKTSYKAVRYLAGKEVEESLDIIPSGDSLEVESTGCEVCRGENYPALNGEERTTAVCGENKYQVQTDSGTEAREKLDELGEISAENEYLIRAEVDGRKISVFNDGRVILKARDKGHAEALVSEILGI
jgi:adenylyltransferase/sulfurtransferase